MIEEIVKHFGGINATARVLNVSPPAVSRWVSTGIVPPFRAIEIEILTRGKFKAADIVKRGEQ